MTNTEGSSIEKHSSDSHVKTEPVFLETDSV